MPQPIKIARSLASPAILIAAVWCAALIGVAVGPVDYPMQPSVPVLVLVAVGVSLFILRGHFQNVVNGDLEPEILRRGVRLSHFEELGA